MNETQGARPRPLDPRLMVAIVGRALAVDFLAGPVRRGDQPRALRPDRGRHRQRRAAPEHTISVAGSGKVTVVPDMATIRLGVALERNTAKAARQAAAVQMTKVVDAIRALGVDEKDIATSQVSLQPVYNYPQNGTPRIRGYQLSNVVTVTVRDLEKVGDVLDDGVIAGATSVDGIGFDVEDRTAAEAKAREAAVKDAKAKADVLASGVGVQITGVASMSETVSTPVWYGDAERLGAMAADTAATPVMAGTTDVTIDVQVSFLID
jgi:uncharacterized protein YggE